VNFFGILPQWLIFLANFNLIPPFYFQQIRIFSAFRSIIQVGITAELWPFCSDNPE